VCSFFSVPEKKAEIVTFIKFYNKRHIQNATLYAPTTASQKKSPLFGDALPQHGRREN
jgi:hypothetical protein